MLLKVSGSPCSGRERRQLWRRRGCFDDIFQPWLKTACPLAARLTKDFVHFSLPNDLDGLINVTQQLAAKPVVLASIMEDRPSAAGTSSWAVKVVKLATATVASSRAADSTLQGPSDVASGWPNLGRIATSSVARLLEVA
uniref:Uncharacterized protein n=1 Tax=Macrostomum lignano TaxID=282301 RepID=A0A1I8FG94_9PLAT